MKGKSEFAQVLDRKLGVGLFDEATVRHQPRPNESQRKAGAFDADWTSKIFFTRGPVKAQVFSAYADAQPPSPKLSLKPSSPKPSSPKSSSPKSLSGPNTAPVATPEVPPKVVPAPEVKKVVPKVKRKLTFDQFQALKVFVSFGEAQIDEYATDQDLKAAYRKLAKGFHPDAGAASDENFKAISRAYQKLVRTSK